MSPCLGRELLMYVCIAWSGNSKMANGTDVNKDY
jgi:hypothetical protein